MRLAIYSRLLKEKDQQYVQDLFDAIYTLDCFPHVYGPYFEQITHKLDIKSPITVFETHQELVEQEIDFLITLGGDGTILEALTLKQDADIPVMGINLGRLGFLASIDKENIHQAIQSLINGAYITDYRTLLQLESNKPLFGKNNFALNDFTILKRDTSSMIIVHTYINGEFLNSYWADGIILSTPTGSTGYSLSCGGPIIYPNSGNFVITPVAPHNLNVRPFVIPDDCVVSFEIEGRAEHFLCTLDSRFEQIDSTHHIAIRKADFGVKLVRSLNRNFLSTIRDKLFWGHDVRNYSS
ncbi:MAG: NAD kinase [Bacteroidota bacterium]